MNLPERFWAKVQPNPETGCWDWFGAKNSRGYGSCQINKVPFLSHRASWIAHNGPIPDGMTIDHRCGRHVCVNPEHMEVVSRKENSRRGKPRSPVRTNLDDSPYRLPDVEREVREPGKCIRGHDITKPGVLRIVNTRNERRCRICEGRLKTTA